jgi:hypothetical protein
MALWLESFVRRLQDPWTTSIPVCTSTEWIDTSARAINNSDSSPSL